MKRLIIFLGIALLTFAIGVAVQSFRNNRSESKEIPAPAAQKFIEAPIEQPPPPFPPQPPPPEKENSDLSIVFHTHESEGSLAVRYFKLQKNRPTVVELDLSESIDGQEVALNFRDYPPAEYRILQRYRTSMSVSNEGPHADLVDWRHFDSPWMELKSIGTRRFRTLASEEMDWKKFPPTTNAEIVEEVRRGGMTKEWVELVKSCNGPNDGACMVAISSIYLRIQKQVSGKWTDIGSVEFQPAMGC